MLRGQGATGSFLSSNFTCYTRAFGGYRLRSLDEELNKLPSKARCYFDTCIVMVGTNDSYVDKLPGTKSRAQTFSHDLSSLLNNFMTRFEPKKLVVFKLLPRAYCMMRHSKGDSCKNIHLPEVMISTNKYIYELNDLIRDVTLNDIKVRFESSDISVLNIWEYMISKGSIEDSFGGLLAFDGLHLSDTGHRWVDTILKDVLF
jgi:hypothetical protein